MPDAPDPKSDISDARIAAAENYARREIAELDHLLASKGQAPCSALERAILVTYIKAKRLGLISCGED